MLRIGRRPWAWLLLLCLALAVGIAVLLTTREPVVCEAHLRRIRLGMTKAEVEAVLGKPQQELFPLLISGPATKLYSPDDAPSGATFYWDDGLLRRNQDILVVSFNNGVVDDCGISARPPDDRSLWQRVRDRAAELRAVVGW